MAYRSIPLEQFSEGEYATANADVTDAIAAGTITSAWDHYVIHGVREGRPGVTPALQSAMTAYYAALPSVPIPPSRLRERVHGPGDAASFQLVGLFAALDLYRAVRETPIPFGEGRVLDFGCGCGRVARCVRVLSEDLDLIGSDIDPEAIAWGHNNLATIGRFIMNPHLPPLPFPDRSFDLVYSVSVFTHLPEDMQFAWLAELARVSRPGGYQVHSIHGEELADRLSEANRRRLRQKGFAYVTGSGTHGLPAFYQTAFHTDDYIRSRWSAHFDVVSIHSRGMAGDQNLVVLRRRAESG